MKKFILILALTIVTHAHSVTLEVTRLCENEPFFEQEIPVYTLTNVLDFTTYNLKNAGIPHQVTVNGVVSILDTKTGPGSYEFLSESHIKIYGWCYEINGVLSNKLPGNHTLDPECEDHIRWYYGYAEIKEGTWLNYCKPVYIEQSPFICD